MPLSAEQGTGGQIHETRDCAGSALRPDFSQTPESSNQRSRSEQRHRFVHPYLLFFFCEPVDIKDLFPE